MIVVGSSALDRPAKDIDIFSTRTEFEWLSNRYGGQANEKGGHFTFGKKKFEFQFSDEWPSCVDIENTHSGRFIDTPIGKLKLIDPEVLAVIKKSHLYRQIQFYKHIKDFHSLLEKLNIKDWKSWLQFKNLEDIYQIRLADTKKHFPDITPKLAKTKDEFFDDYVEKTFVHDEIHFIVKHREKPMYEFCQRGTEVQCDKSLWEKLSYEDKLNMVREEALVIGLERKIIPKWNEGEDPKRHYRDGFYYAAMRICTNLCRGWFREFAQLNYPQIMEYDYSSKFDYFFDCFNQGLIRKI